MTAIPNAPIQELIVEVRWNSTEPLTFQSDGSVSFGSSAETLADMMADAGFGLVERIQGGAVVNIGMPSLRFRNRKDASALFQFGPGIFTCNARPPYEEWSKFRERVTSALTALFKAFGPEKLTGLHVGIRYLDLFQSNLHMKGMSPIDFLHTIGLTTTLPEGINKFTAEQKLFRSNLSFKVKDSAAYLHINFSDQGQNLVLDTGILGEMISEPSVEKIMAALNANQDKLHDLFMVSIKPHLGPKA